MATILIIAALAGLIAGSRMVPTPEEVRKAVLKLRKGKAPDLSGVHAELIQAAATNTFRDRAGGADVEKIVEYFEQGGALQIGEDASASACVQGFETVPGLLKLVESVGLAPSNASAGTRAAACELALEALVGERRINRNRTGSYGRARHDGPNGKGFQGFDHFAT